MTEIKPKKCFVIMPFSLRDSDLQKYSNDKQHWSEVYKGLIKPAIEKAGLRAERDDDDDSSRLIAENIWRKIEEADVILCDLSSYNPNVHLELGWSLRANKKFVLVKDDLTSFNFDLNQFYTFEYSHRLQPSFIRQGIDGLSNVLMSTINDSENRYSIVNRLSIQQQATKEAGEGNIEVSLLKEILSKIQYSGNKGYSITGMTEQKINVVTPKINDREDLIKALTGSTWRKNNNLEHIIFKNDSVFYNNHAGHPSWRENSYRLLGNIDEMELVWSIDGLKALCRFRNNYTEFVELANPEECLWRLISLEPFTPSWGI